MMFQAPSGTAAPSQIWPICSGHTPYCASNSCGPTMCAGLIETADQDPLSAAAAMTIFSVSTLERA